MMIIHRLLIEQSAISEVGKRFEKGRENPTSNALISNKHDREAFEGFPEIACLFRIESRGHRI